MRARPERPNPQASGAQVKGVLSYRNFPRDQTEVDPMSTEASAAAKITNLPDPASPTKQAEAKPKPEPAKAAAAKTKPRSAPADAPEAVENYFSAGRERIQEAFETMNGQFDGLREAAREASDAVQESQTQAVAGLRDLSDATLNGVQSGLDRYFETVKAMTAASSLPDLLEIQASFVRESVAARTEQTRALSEIAVDTVKAAFEPLQSGLSQAARKASKQDT